MSAVSFAKSETLDKTPAGEAREEILKDLGIASSSLEFINDLLRNMLDEKIATSGRMKLLLEPIDVLHDVLQPVASILFMRGVTIDVKIDCPEELFVISDRIRLKQICLNLAGT